MLPAGLASALADALGAPVAAAAAVHGGDVAQAFRLDLGDGRRVFAKTHPAPPPLAFGTEAAGLAWIGAAGAVAVPEVLAVSDSSPAFLALAWVDEGRFQPGTEAALGRALAALHRAGARCFGREDRRTTGTRRLPNEPCASWPTFYATQRLAPLARLARDAGALPAAALAALDRLADPDRLHGAGGADEPPARLHGDLWAGNRLVDREGRSWLVDPAAHGGHREHDLAMMRLFGGFGPGCFAAYGEAWPLADGWERRVALHQVTPLVVHAVKLAGSYVAAAAAAIDRAGRAL